MSRPINLFWTGGWDSTFRLLQLVVVEKKPVQPIYVIDSGRKSIVFEIKTMEKIISLVNNKFPELCANLLDVKFLYKDSTSNVNGMRDYFEQFRSQCHIGHQYLWLAITSEKHGLFEVEIAQEKVDIATSQGTWISLVLPLLTGEGHDCKLDVTTAKDNKKLLLFKNYRYPLLNVTKQDMAEIAKAHDFYSILKFSWFCHRPVFNKPCGVCRPCKIAKRNGELTVHKMNTPFVSKAYNFAKKIEQRLFNIVPYEQVLLQSLLETEVRSGK